MHQLTLNLTCVVRVVRHLTLTLTLKTLTVCGWPLNTCVFDSRAHACQFMVGSHVCDTRERVLHVALLRSVTIETPSRPPTTHHPSTYQAIFPLPPPLFRQLDTSGAHRMRHEMWGGRRRIGGRGHSGLQHVETLRLEDKACC